MLASSCSRLRHSTLILNAHLVDVKLAHHQFIRIDKRSRHLSIIVWGILVADRRSRMQLAVYVYLFCCCCCAPQSLLLMEFFFRAGFGPTPSLFNNGISALQKSFINRRRSIWQWLKIGWPLFNRSMKMAPLPLEYISWVATVIEMESCKALCRQRWMLPSVIAESDEFLSSVVAVAILFLLLPLLLLLPTPPPRRSRSSAWWIHYIKDNRSWKTQSEESPVRSDIYISAQSMTHWRLCNDICCTYSL